MEIARVVPIQDYRNQTPEIEQKDDNEANEEESVEAEKLEMFLMSQRRFESYKNILYKKQNEVIPCYVAFYAFSGVILAFLMNSFTAFMPVSDIIQDQDVSLLERVGSRITRFIGIPGIAINYFFVFTYWTNTRCIGNWKTFGLILLWMTIFGTLFPTLFYILWDRIFGFRPPLPFQQNLVGVSIGLMVILIIWLLLPSKWRKDKSYQKRYRYYIATHFYGFFILYKYTALGKLFIEVNPNYQWILALSLPFLRELDIWIQENWAHKAADSNDTSVTISVHHNINTQHCIFLAAILGSNATNLSSWIILGSDFIYNGYLALKLIWIKKTRSDNEDDNQKMFQLLLSLVINELVEVLVPVTFLICFLSAYYGPNAEKIGGVKSTHFHYEPVTDINGFVKNLMIFMTVDVISVVCGGTILWMTCKISLPRAYMTMQKEFWPIITITNAFYVWVVSKIIMYNIYRKVFVECLN